jgi:hypothetical protein
MGVMSEEKKVEQDERGTFEAWAKGKFNLKPLSGEGAFFYDKENTQAAWSAWQARAASTSADVAQGAENTDDIAVDSFARAMKEKMAAARAKGRSGWEGCEPADLSRMLREHIEKGDPRDVANFCMMLWHHSAPIAPPAQTSTTDDARDAERYRWLRKEHFPTADNPPLAQVVWKSSDNRRSSKWVNLINGNDLDSAIDAALTAAQSGDKS